MQSLTFAPNTDPCSSCGGAHVTLSQIQRISAETLRREAAQTRFLPSSDVLVNIRLDNGEPVAIYKSEVPGKGSRPTVFGMLLKSLAKEQDGEAIIDITRRLQTMKLSYQELSSILKRHPRTTS